MALYDPKELPKTAEATPDFTLADLLAWARTKPADEAYDYESNEDCAIAQFLVQTGRAREVLVGSRDWCAWVDGNWGEDRFFDYQASVAAREAPYTFGSLADRLEQALSA